ncbi:MAG: ATP-binding protein [Kiritimatiellae bacterium]|nr:ATP-binding protein [Kiritimatiellia bacterium]
MRNDYVEILKTQKRELERLISQPDLIERAQLGWFEVNSTLAYFAVGVRRCGKSVLCRMALAKSGFPFGYIDFDDEPLHDVQPEDLNDLLEAVYVVYGPVKHLFMDEIQDVPAWQLFVNRLLRQGMHIVITGSNSRLLTDERATHLTGRHIPVELTPFTFAEYRRYLGRGEAELAEGRAEARRDYEAYAERGGFPETFRWVDVRNYYKSLYDSIVYRDILQRHRIREVALFNRVARAMMENYACQISANKLARQLESNSPNTVQNFIHFMEEAYLVYTVSLYGRKAWERTRIGKAYAVDPGFANYFTGYSPGDDRLGRRLENIVYLQLRNKQHELDFEVYYYRDDRHEVDFLCQRRVRTMKLVQVCYDMPDEKTRNRELSALFEIGAKFNCDDLVVVTDHEDGEVKHGKQTVRIVNVVAWLLEMDKERIRDDFFAKSREAADEVRKAVAKRKAAKKDG